MSVRWWSPTFGFFVIGGCIFLISYFCFKIHTEKKQFKCNVCGKGFFQMGNLQIHIRVHIGENPYSCTVCKKMFSIQGNLNEHLRIHTGEKPFEKHLI